MSYFAVIENGVVTNVIVADNKNIAETVTQKTCIEYPTLNDAGIGWTYDGTSFIKPLEPILPLLKPEDAPK